ncbi:ABC transporter substrate-binding protein [Streptomyces sp. NPDC060030]|uniref:ABC transporter substrate-binding protein n=1 Tax=Streptomyces sp. NPDC060030 TaxID=3347042 RepID=UPI0036CB7AB8
MRRHALQHCCSILALVLSVTACGLSEPVESEKTDVSLAGQTVAVAGPWSGGEREKFQKVLDAFSEKTGAKTEYISTGQNVSSVISAAIAGGHAPDVVMVPQVGVLKQFAKRGWLTPLSEQAHRGVDAKFARVWQEQGSVDDVLYGVYFKATHKSMVWYDPGVLAKAGLKQPRTWTEMLNVGHVLAEFGLAAVSVAGKDGWTLTDWFENIYLSQAGPEKYDALAARELKWTDRSVIEALATLGRLFSDTELLAGGPKAALNADLPGSVGKVFGPNPEAGLVYEGDFVAGIAKEQFNRNIGKEVQFFPFPAVGRGYPPVISGGDAAVVLKDGKNSKTGMRLVEYLTTYDAAAVWAKEGGFISPNISLSFDNYKDSVARTTAESLIGAVDRVRFDMSDQAPADFGGTEGKGEWKLLQDFLRSPSDPETTAAKLEAAAAEGLKP